VIIELALCSNPGRRINHWLAGRSCGEGQAAPEVTNITMIEFPSMEHARAWYHDPEYAPMKRLRQTGSRLNFLLVQGANYASAADGCATER
jgi:hypothetical protein